MVELIKKQRHFLKVFIRTSPKQRKALLQTITRDQLKVVSQIAYNILRFTIKLTPVEKARLKRYRHFLYALGNKKVGYQQKKKGIPDNSG